MSFEGLHRVLIKGGDKDHQRQLGGIELAQNAESVESGHLNVEQHHVGSMTSDGRDGGWTVGGFARDLEVRLLRQKHSEPLAGEGFVIDDQNGKRPWGHGREANAVPVESAEALEVGMRITAAVPPPGAGERSSPAPGVAP